MWPVCCSPTKELTSQPLGRVSISSSKKIFNIEKSLRSRGNFEEFSTVMEEYLENKHAELVPTSNLEKSSNEVFYLLIHAVWEESSTTTKV